MSECHLEITTKTLENAWFMATNHPGARQQFKDFMFKIMADEYSAGFHAGRIATLGECEESGCDD